MEEIKEIVDELSIEALEADTKIAAIAVVSDTGELIIQTSNWNLSNETNAILKVRKGESSFNLNNMDFNVVERTNEGIIGTNNQGNGHILMSSFQGGMLIAYAMPTSNTLKSLSFLRNYALKLNGKI